MILYLNSEKTGRRKWGFGAIETVGGDDEEVKHAAP